MEEHAAGDRVLLASARERAQALLEAGGEAKPAVVKLLLDTDIENARRLLERAEGSVRRAVAD